ncbi:MAG: GNAT family N-acetyltransferase, partial [Pyrinomonadaceae bacterium]
MPRRAESESGGAASEAAQITVRECATIEEFDACVRLQREAFGLPDLELSPRRHLIVSREAGGWTLGAFAGAEMIGFVHHLAAVNSAREIVGYSHMMAVAGAYQNRGVGARLKWAQRERALAEGVSFIKWTWDPMQARNAHFNINRLGVVVRSYAINFYGTDYSTIAGAGMQKPGIDSDRLFGNWELSSAKVEALAARNKVEETTAPVATVEVPPNWSALVREDP